MKTGDIVRLLIDGFYGPDLPKGTIGIIIGPGVTFTDHCWVNFHVNTCLKTRFVKHEHIEPFSGLDLLFEVMGVWGPK